jgi:hypothetical protein
MQSSGQTKGTGIDSELERGEYRGGESGFKIHTFELQAERKTGGSSPGDVSEENLLPLEGPGIVKLHGLALVWRRRTAVS